MSQLFKEYNTSKHADVGIYTAFSSSHSILTMLLDGCCMLHACSLLC